MGLRKFRLASGLVLAVFLGLHLINHALGLFGLSALEAGRHVFHAIWAEPWGIAVLALAFPTHVILSLYALYLRRSYRQVNPREWLQLGLGVLIPPLLCIHILGTLGINLLFDSQPDYGFLLLVMFHFSPIAGAQQLLVLVVAWAHAALGLHFWWRLKPFYQGWGGIIRLGFWLLPTLALTGIAASAREVLFLAQDNGWVQQWLQAARAPNAEQTAFLYRLEATILGVYGALLAGVFLARWLRRVIERRQGLVQVTYPGDRQIAVKPGFSLLDASLMAGVPHAHVCGGRGRCSTCRVRVLKGAQHLPEASSEERKVLQRIAAGPDLRLACQTRPTGDVSIVPLLPPNASPRDGFPRPGYLQGQEREIVVLFADLRGFTSLSEHRLPYDVVFILNRYFRATGQAIEENGGHLDKFIGDGVMALFGLESTPEVAARQALAAVRQMGEALRELNSSLVQELGQPLRIGVGLHLGAAIVGEMGHGQAVHLTAIGDTVNAASRLESATKELQVELVLSEKLARAAGWELPGAGRHDIDLKGREGKLAVLAVGNLADLSALSPQEGLAAR